MDFVLQGIAPATSQTFPAGRRTTHSVLSTSSLANGLISFYNLNSNANDSVGANNGTISNISWASSFNGAPCATSTSNLAYIDLGTAPTLNLMVLSISIWVLVPTTGSYTPLVWDAGKGATASTYELRLDQFNNVQWYARGLGLWTGPALSTGSWHHVVAIQRQFRNS